MEVRRLREGEGALVRELRLRALCDAPYAFSSSLEREAAYPPEHWERLVGDPVFIAVEGAEWLGMAGGYLPRDKPGTGVLWGLWVAPGARRRGLARRLVEAVAG
ncbi:MAG: GNAT family N-acetyltransferase, partial [Solirubrobacteraceae bacterium]